MDFEGYSPYQPCASAYGTAFNQKSRHYESIGGYLYLFVVAAIFYWRREDFRDWGALHYFFGVSIFFVFQTLLCIETYLGQISELKQTIDDTIERWNDKVEEIIDKLDGIPDLSD